MRLRSEKGIFLSQPAKERFWQNVAIDDGCWLWTGGKNQSGAYGYGRLKVGEKNKLAHRYSYELHHGPISDDIDVLHSCDNPPCVNPTHLRVGTAKDNAQDCLVKGRKKIRLGEQINTARLTEDQVIRIYSVQEYAGVNKDLAIKFGVHKDTIRLIRIGQTWKSVTGAA